MWKAVLVRKNTWVRGTTGISHHEKLRAAS
jgi:hypothetical protein